MHNTNLVQTVSVGDAISTLQRMKNNAESTRTISALCGDETNAVLLRGKIDAYNECIGMLRAIIEKEVIVA